MMMRTMEGNFHHFSLGHKDEEEKIILSHSEKNLAINSENRTCSFFQSHPFSLMRTYEYINISPHNQKKYDKASPLKLSERIQ